jgi:TonB-linked SusC/RagA family outer membrane protein
MAKITKTAHSCAYFLYVILLAAISSTAFAQKSIEITGSVVDERTNQPIIGSSVILANTTTGAITDVEGNFALRTNKLPVTLLVSFIGYTTSVIEVYEVSEPITVFLREHIGYLNEIVVVGYGTQKRKELTGSVASIPQNVLAQVTPSFDRSLGGTVAGLNVTQSSGQPGATSSIRIRGGNSITGGNEPLYVIDGFILYNDNSSTRTGAGKIDGSLNPLTGINSADIESVEVLKDVSATAIYGSRGANGVILITTKKGKKGSNHINYQGVAGWQQVSKKLDLLNAEEWTAFYHDIAGNAPIQTGPNVDWQDAALRTAFTQNHQISASGGDEKTRYLISGNYTQQDGVIKNTGFDKYAARVNLDRDLSKKLNIGVNLSVSNSVQQGLPNWNGRTSNGSLSNPFDYALRIPPVVPIYNGSGYNYGNPYVEGDYRLEGFAVNPISDLLNTTAETKSTSLIGNFVASYTIIPSLVAKVNAGANLNNTVQNFYAPSTSALGLLLNGSGSVGNKRYTSWQTEVTLNYNKRINEANNIEVLAGYTTQKSTVEYSTATSNDYANESLGHHNLAGGSTAISPTSGGAESVLNSWLGRINYSLLGRYNFTATIRADGSSRFAPNKRWGYFPSIGAAWNINEEAFYNQSSVVNTLKLRLSAGTVGNQEIGDYRYEDYYSPSKYSFGGKTVIAYARSNRANPDLKWETTTQYNAGLDIGLWKDRLSLSLDAYSKKTSDLLVEIPVEITSGFASVLTNIGDVTNKGFELALNAVIIQQKDFNWNASFVIAKNINEITDLGSLNSFVPGFSLSEGTATLENIDPLIVQKGQPLGSFYGFVFDGVVQTGDNVANIAVPGWIGSVSPGDPKFVNQNGDNVIDNADKVILGNAQPKFTYGLSSSLNYKSFDLFFAFQGSYGNHLYNGLRHKLETTSVFYNAAGALRDRWTPTNPSNTIPRAINAPYLTLDSRYIEDASYLRLKNITLGYTLPFKISKVPGSQFRIFASAQNLFVITDYTGFDPEASYYGGDETNGLYQGIDFGAYPSAKTYSLGLNLTF